MGNGYEPEIHRRNQKGPKNKRKGLTRTAISKMPGNVAPSGI